jgi:hypothetical protein
MEDGGVRGFVQCPNAIDAEALLVDAAQGFAEGEDSVEARKTEELDLLRRRGGAMVGIVEEQEEMQAFAQGEKKLGK